jgi:hypothetical protein
LQWWRSACGAWPALEIVRRSKVKRSSRVILSFIFCSTRCTEHYELVQSRDDSQLTFSDSFEYTDGGTKIPLSATLEMASDATPVRLEQQGKSYRYFSADAAVETRGDQATVRDAFGERQVRAPAAFFAVSGYAPLAVQQMMLRYWLRHGRPVIFPRR